MPAVPRDRPGVAMPSVEPDMARDGLAYWSNGLLTWARGVAWSRAANEDAGDKVGEAVPAPRFCARLCETPDCAEVVPVPDD